MRLARGTREVPELSTCPFFSLLFQAINVQDIPGKIQGLEFERQ